MYIMNYMTFVVGVQFKEYMYLYLENYPFTPLHRGQRVVASKTINTYNRPTPTGLVHAFQ